MTRSYDEYIEKTSHTHISRVVHITTYTKCVLSTNNCTLLTLIINANITLNIALEGAVQTL